jgi:hypothetical protein
MKAKRLKEDGDKGLKKAEATGKGRDGEKMEWTDSCVAMICGCGFLVGQSGRWGYE